MAGKSSIGGPPEDHGVTEEVCTLLLVMLCALVVAIPVIWIFSELSIAEEVPAGPSGPAVEVPR